MICLHILKVLFSQTYIMNQRFVISCKYPVTNQLGSMNPSRHRSPDCPASAYGGSVLLIVLLSLSRGFGGFFARIAKSISAGLLPNPAACTALTHRRHHLQQARTAQPSANGTDFDGLSCALSPYFGNTVERQISLATAVWDTNTWQQLESRSIM